MVKEDANNEEENKGQNNEDWGDWKTDWHNKNWRQRYWMRRHHRRHYGRSGSSALYFFGFIGSLVYFWQQANTFWMVVMGFLQSIVWPAILVWHLFSFLKL